MKKICFRLITVFLTIIPNSIISQNHYVKIILESELNMEEKQIKIDSLLNPNTKLTHSELADIHHDLALRWYFKKWKDSHKQNFLLNSIEHTQKAIDLKKNLDSVDIYSLKRSLYNLGVLQNHNKKIFSSIDAYQEVIKLGKEDDRTLAAYQKLALALIEIGDFQKALESTDNAINVLYRLGINHHGELTLYIIKLDIYSDMGYIDFSKEIDHFLIKVDSIIKNNQVALYQQVRANQHRGNHALMLKDYKTAIKEHEKNLLLNRQELSSFYVPSVLDIIWGIAHNSLGVSFEKLGDSTLGVQHLWKAIELDPSSSLPYENLGDLYASRKHFKEGLKNYQKAIYLASNQALNEDVTILPEIENLKVAIEKKHLLGHLIQKANAWLDYYKHDGNQDHLTQALTTFQRADELIDIIRSQSTEYQSKLYWRGQSSKLYMKAVEVSLLLDKPEKAYYFMERNKALLLLEDITHEKAKELSQLPDSIAKREFELKRAIHLAENTLQNSASASQDSVQNLKNEIFQFKRNYEKYMDSLTIAFPNYARLKQQFQVLPYQDFRSNFSSEETATLQFILNGEQGYALLHANGKPLFYELEHASVLNENLLKFYSGLSNFNEKIEETNLASNAIFKTLLPPQAFEAIKNKELIIVPDYNLQKIPFEALVTNLIDQRYLLEDTELRYAYSLSYLDAKKQVQTQAEEDLLALAPVDFENLGLAKLGFSGLEVNGLKSIFGGEIWLNEEASKENLLQNLERHGILHFATHADIDDNGNHWVAFSDDKLYLNEIYATRNQAEMVVLSACNTSRGELKNGEGVMSLARAFFNSGAKSVVSSLWPTVDKTSKDIMIDFYRGLDEGLPKATALRNAKINYLKVKPEASPAQWAALIVIGDNAPVKKPNFLGDNWPWMAFAGGLLLIPVFLWKRSRKQAA